MNLTITCFQLVFYMYPPGKMTSVVTTSYQRLSVHLNDVAGMSEIKHPTTSPRNLSKTSQWCVSGTTLKKVVATSQAYVVTTYHLFVFTTSQTSFKWSTQWFLDGTSPRRLHMSHKNVVRTFLYCLTTTSLANPNWNI